MLEGRETEEEEKMSDMPERIFAGIAGWWETEVESKKPPIMSPLTEYIHIDKYNRTKTQRTPKETELIAKVKKLEEELRHIIMTGYTSDIGSSGISL